MNTELDRLLQVYTFAIQCARGNKQTVGEKNDYYVTIAQLEEIIRVIQLENV